MARIAPRTTPKLQGQKVSERDDGPWAVRTTLAAGGGGYGVGAKALSRKSRTRAAPMVDSVDFKGEPAEPEMEMDMGSSTIGLASVGTVGRGSGDAAYGSGGLGVSGVGAGGGGMARSVPLPDLVGKKGKAKRDVAMKARPAPQASPLKAGSTDDNKDFSEFVAFLSTWTDRPGVADRWSQLDVRDRRFVSVVDEDGDPVPGARVDILDAKSERLVFTGTTYGDGRVAFYPKVFGEAEGAGFLINVQSVAGAASDTWDGQGETVEVRCREDADLGKTKLDVLFVIDTTGSMSDEIDRIKGTLLSVTKKLKGSGQDFDLMYGAVLYRDVGDEYLTSTHRFTRDIEGFDRALQGVRAGGGGDGPESLNQGLLEAVHGVEWRQGAERVAFLIADAPPHMDYPDDVPYGDTLKDALGLGIRIHSVAASGLDDFGTLVFRQVAQFTRGKFIFIEYGGSVAATAESHGVKGQVKSNNLDDIVYEQIRWELDNWGARAG
jgi:hypothetical protein